MTRRLLLLPLAVLGLVVLAPLTVLVVATWLAGWRLQPVDTESMAPAYPAGALLVVQPVNPSDVEPGTVVVFEDPGRPGRLVAHRVVARAPGPAFRTQGDANQDMDPYPVAARDVRGVVRWGIPGLGGLARTFRWPVNAIVLIGVPAALLVASELRGWRRGRDPSAAVTATGPAGA